MTRLADNRPLKVCLVTPRFAPYVGGVETHVEQLATQLAACGNQVQVVTQASRQVLAEAGVAEQRNGFTVRRCVLPRGAHTDLVGVDMMRTLQALEVDIIHAHNYHALPAACAAALAGPRPFVLTPHYHGVGSTRLTTAMHQLYRPLIGRRAMDRAETIIAVSASEKSLLVRDFGVRLGRRTRVVPNGVDVPGHRNVAREDGLILSVGRLNSYKRVDVLLNALALLPERFRLVIVGDGPQRSQLTSQVEALGLSHRALLTGQVDDDELASWIARASIFATASQIEAFGITLANAVAAGLPAVASTIPAHRDVLNMAFPVALPPDVALVPPKTNDALAGAAFATAITSVTNAVQQPARPHHLPSWSDVAEQLVTAYGELRGGAAHEPLIAA